METQAPERSEHGAAAMTDALDLAFRLLRWVLVALVPVYLLSGVRIVRQHERGVVLVWGRIAGLGEERVWGPGLHWALPRPFAEVVTLEAGRVRTLEIKGPVPPGGPERPAPPGREDWAEYLLTGDANLMRAGWALRYTVADPEAFLFAFADAEAALRAELAHAVVKVTAGFPVDRALRTDLEAYRAAVEEEVRRRAAALGLGVRVERLDALALTPPAPVAEAFDDVTRAENERSSRISEARAYAARRQNEALGEAAKLRSEADAYRTRLVSATRADAEYFEQIRPQYAARPDVIGRTLLQDALRSALSRVPQKYFLHREAGGKQELRLWLGPEMKKPGAPPAGGGK